MDNVFEQLDAKASCLQRQLASSNPTLQQQALEVILQLVQFPKLFRPAFCEFLATLPVTIYISHRSLVTSRVTGTASGRRRSADYVGYQCAFKMPDGADCLTLTSIPYMTDTYFTGPATILAAAGNPSLTATELETQIKTGLKLTFCHRHTEQEKIEQANSLALPIRHVCTRWRGNERRWREVGKTSPEQLAWPAGPNGTSRSRRDDSAVWSSSSSSTASDRAVRETEGLKEQIRHLREENHRLREEIADLSAGYRHEH